MTPPSFINRRQAFTTAGLGLFGGSLAASTRAVEPSAAASPHRLDLRDFRAKGDGTADDTTAFQTALEEACQGGGGSVYVPPGRYLIGAHLTVPQNVTLEGIFTAPPTTPWRSDTPDGKPQLAGSVLLAVEGAGKPDGTPFIRLKTNATLKGLAIFYPAQTNTNPPIAYPWTIQTTAADNLSIIDVLLVNPYQAVDFGSAARRAALRSQPVRCPALSRAFHRSLPRRGPRGKRPLLAVLGRDRPGR